ncbi:hypothetical protein ACIPW9_00685 [Streptomyces sp. NPDC090052]|uniref:hypothetical protein n=1 Tax=Streptomyces sp. NPDC090052 TaxID=3365931 RepID=UPI0037F2A62B
MSTALMAGAPRRFTFTMMFLVLALAGCSQSEAARPKNHKTITHEQAAARAEQLIRETVNELTPRPKLEIYQPGSADAPCLDPTDGGSENRQVISRGYWLRGISRADNRSIGKQVLHLWKKKGDLITSTTKIGTDRPEIHGGSKPDDFLIALESSDNGWLSIGATSPCIWPQGTPPPEK